MCQIYYVGIIISFFVTLAPKKPKTVLDQVLDYDSGGVSKDLGQIADCMDKWEGPVAEKLGLSEANISAIKADFKDFNLQV